MGFVHCCENLSFLKRLSSLEVTWLFHFLRQTEKNNQNGFGRLTLWSMYLLSSMAERLEWSQEEDEAEGRRRNKQLVSCCCRSMNCFMKLSLEGTTTQRHNNTAGRVPQLINLKKVASAGLAAGTVRPNVIIFPARFSFFSCVATDSLFADRHFNICECNRQTDLRRSRLTDGLQRRISEGVKNPAVH